MVIRLVVLLYINIQVLNMATLKIPNNNNYASLFIVKGLPEIKTGSLTKLV